MRFVQLAVDHDRLFQFPDRPQLRHLPSLLPELPGLAAQRVEKPKMRQTLSAELAIPDKISISHGEGALCP